MYSADSNFINKLSKYKHKKLKEFITDSEDLSIGSIVEGIFKIVYASEQLP